MDHNTFRIDSVTSSQPRQIPGHDHPSSPKTQASKHVSNEREADLMQHLQELKGVVRELVGQVAAATARRHQTPQMPATEHQDLHRSQGSSDSGGGPR